MTRPTPGELKRLCPQVAHEFLEGYLEEFGGRYYERFERDVLAEHVRALAKLSSDHLTELIVRPGGSANGQLELEVTVIGFNYTGVFSAITGLLAATGLDIVSGEIFTSQLQEEGENGASKTTGHRRYIVDLFTGRLRGGADPAPWQDDFSALLNSVVALY